MEPIENFRRDAFGYLITSMYNSTLHASCEFKTSGIDFLEIGYLSPLQKGINFRIVTIEGGCVDAIQMILVICQSLMLITQAHKKNFFSEPWIPV